MVEILLVMANKQMDFPIVSHCVQTQLDVSMCLGEMDLVISNQFSILQAQITTSGVQSSLHCHRLPQLLKRL
jgi:hypothetical protein